MKSIKHLGFITSFLGLYLVLIQGCTVQKTKILTEQEVATKWAEMTLFVTKNTPANSPTYASRALGYIGVTMYESIVHGFPEYQSLVSQLNGLQQLPLPQKNIAYKWILSLNAGQAYILKKMYNQTSDANKQRIDSLEKVIFEQFAEGVEKEPANQSVAYGQAVAEAVFQWSVSDGGHRGYLKNFDKTFLKDSVRPGSWEPPLYGQSFSHFPLHPYWGKNRTFLKINAELPVPEMIFYKKQTNSDYYKQCMQVYEKSKILTQAEKEAALWWGDDPSDTFTPPGHSYYLATLVLKKIKPDLIKCAETYARVGMAVADAFINCWKWKYHFFSERPSSFITKNIDSQWESFWPDPPFPAFPSGHATQAAAVATVLADLFGDKITFTDDAHAGRPRDELRNVEFKPRIFTSFWQVAEETANSRFYGGIHTPQDNAIGLTEGKKMGNNVNALHWKHEKNYTASHP
jgi:hypothetical protein